MNLLSVSLWKRFKTVCSIRSVLHSVITKRYSLSGCSHFLSELTIVQLYEAFTDQDFSSIFDRGFSLVEISKPTNYWIKHLFRTPEQYNLCWPTSCQLSLTVPIFRRYIIATQGAPSKSEKKTRCSKQVRTWKLSEEWAHQAPIRQRWANWGKLRMKTKLWRTENGKNLWQGEKYDAKTKYTREGSGRFHTTKDLVKVEEVLEHKPE